mmetsp:Transcript_5100/g.20514  ORF Transcript_5100/g.20514 Transcript_5100/m.20514 type:complete len:233 (+) Transcript_5100:113-811(+)
MSTRSASARNSPSPSRTPKASTNSGMLDTVPFTRTSHGACGSTAMYFAASFAVMFWRHTVAHEKKKRFSGSGGKFSGAPFGSPSARDMRHARYARRSPPRSAMFSPCVSSPFTTRHWHAFEATALIPGLVSENGPRSFSSHASSCVCTTVRPAWSTITFARFTKSAASLVDHQSFMFPSLSNLRPWSSKPCVISWPMTAPMPPKLIAGSAFGSKNGGCKIAAGNTISFSIGW